jgi:hypothetical protein
MTRMKTALTLVAACVLAALGLAFVPRPSVAAEDAQPALADLAWLAGHWGSEKDGRLTEEVWLAPAGGLLLGMNRSSSQGGRTEFEYLRIVERKSGIVYVASPGGGPSTDFPLVEARKGFALFENPAHDFPRRLHYELDAEGALRVRASGEMGGQERTLEWTWSRR